MYMYTACCLYWTLGFPHSSHAQVVASVTLHTHMWGLIPSSCVWNARIHSCLLSVSLGKRCKETKLSFAHVLPCITHQSPGILVHNTSIFRHFGTSTTRSRNIISTQLLRYITLQAFIVYVFAKLHQSVPCLQGLQTWRHIQFDIAINIPCMFCL